MQTLIATVLLLSGFTASTAGRVCFGYRRDTCMGMSVLAETLLCQSGDDRAWQLKVLLDIRR